MSAIPAGVDRNLLPFAIDGEGNLASVMVDGLENPHVLVCGGSQTGKTFALRLIAAYAASLGMIVVVFDPKWRWKGLFPARLPHVLVYDRPDEWFVVIEAVERELERRYRLDQLHQAQGGREIIKDRDRFPGFLVIGDEFGTLLGMSEQRWLEKKEKGDPKESPVHREWQLLLWRGAECGIVLMSANHMATADMFPRGTKSRQMYGQQLLLGNEKEPTAYAAVMGRKAEVVEVPHGIRGAGVWRLGNGPVRRIQTLWVEPARLAVMAAHGIAVLRAGGHLDVAGRLRLHTDPAVLLPRPTSIVSGPDARPREAPISPVRPGDLRGVVPSAGQDNLSSSAGDPDTADVAELGDAAPAQRAAGGGEQRAEEGLVVIGYANAAEYLRVAFGRDRYTGEQFRKDIARKGVELASEGKSGRQLMWSVANLRAWHRAAFPRK